MFDAPPPPGCHPERSRRTFGSCAPVSRPRTPADRKPSWTERSLTTRHSPYSCGKRRCRMRQSPVSHHPSLFCRAFSQLYPSPPTLSSKNYRLTIVRYVPLLGGDNGVGALPQFLSLSC